MQVLILEGDLVLPLPLYRKRGRGYIGVIIKIGTVDGSYNQVKIEDKEKGLKITNSVQMEQL